jgi:hypothetical protein
MVPHFPEILRGETETGGVDNNELGSMGKVVTKVYNDQEIKLCCKPCIKKFDANPAKYLSKLK